MLQKMKHLKQMKIHMMIRMMTPMNMEVYFSLKTSQKWSLADSHLKP